MAPDTIHGFADGDTIVDGRTGWTGTVRFIDLTPAERASGECAEAEIRWPNSFVAEELDEYTAPNFRLA